MAQRIALSCGSFKATWKRLGFPHFTVDQPVTRMTRDISYSLHLLPLSLNYRIR